MASNENTANPGWNPDDPHGFHEHQEHGHHILSARMLIGVLAILVVLTILTVALSLGEGMLAEAIGITIPQWVNVAIAMSIATVKGIVVALFFMQLLYDNKLNMMIMAFCLLVFAIFLGFTAIDVTGRERITRFKEDIPSQGGTGIERTKMRPDANVLSMALNVDVGSYFGRPDFLYMRTYMDDEGATRFVYSDDSKVLTETRIVDGESQSEEVASWDAERDLFVLAGSDDTVSDFASLRERFDLDDYQMSKARIKMTITGPIGEFMKDPKNAGEAIGYEKAKKQVEKHHAEHGHDDGPSANSAGDNTGNRLFKRDDEHHGDDH